MEQGGGFFTRKLGGVPAWVWLAGAAVVVYYLMSRHSSQSAGSPKTTGGGGQITTGNTRVERGAITVHVNASDQEQPGPSHKGRHNRLKTEHGALIVPRDESFAQFAEQFHLTNKQIADFTADPQPKGSSLAGKKLELSTQLKKGQKIYG